MTWSNAGLATLSVSVNALKLVEDARCEATPHLLLLALSLWTLLVQAAELAFRGWRGYLRVLANWMHCPATLLGVGVSITGIVRRSSE